MKRSPDFFKNNTVRKGKQLICKVPVTIEVPETFFRKGLIEFGESTFFMGVCAFISGDTYSVGLIPSMFRCNPPSVNEVKREDGVYYQFQFPKNGILIEDMEVVLKDTITYNLFDLFFMEGKIPWFINYTDCVVLLGNHEKYAGSYIGSNRIVNEMMTAYITRLKSDPQIQLRFDPGNKDFRFVGLENVFFSTPSTLNKLAGNYFKDAMVSALITHQDEPTKLERVIRR